MTRQEKARDLLERLAAKGKAIRTQNAVPAATNTTPQAPSPQSK